jgi:hypothetical protein
MEVDKDYAGSGTTAMAVTGLSLIGAKLLGIIGNGNLAPALFGEGRNAEIITLRKDAERDREVLDLKLKMIEQQNAFNTLNMQKDIKLMQSFINVTGAFSTAAVSLATLSPVAPVLQQGNQGT